jgi:hypothetical protein
MAHMQGRLLPPPAIGGALGTEAMVRPIRRPSTPTAPCETHEEEGSGAFHPTLTFPCEAYKGEGGSGAPRPDWTVL